MKIILSFLLTAIAVSAFGQYYVPPLVWRQYFATNTPEDLKATTVYVSASSNGAAFGPHTPGTTTCGIQEAINALATAAVTVRTVPMGGTVVLGPGIYWTSNAIVIPDRTNLVSYVLQGPGAQAGGITYYGSLTQSVVQVGQGRPLGNSLNFQGSLNFAIRDMWVSSTNQFAFTNLLFINGRNGGIWRAEVQNCWFAPWSVLTNYPKGTGGADLSTEVCNMIGVDIQCNLGADMAYVRGNQFYGLACGIYWATDHGSANDNFFGYVGNWPDWAAGTKFKNNAAIVTGESGGTLDNAQEDWSFSRNFFMGCLGGYFLHSTMYQTAVSYEDCFERDAGAFGVKVATNDVVMTNGTRWILMNPRSKPGTYLTNWVVDGAGTVLSNAEPSIVRRFDLALGLNGTNVIDGTLTGDKFAPEAKISFDETNFVTITTNGDGSLHISQGTNIAATSVTVVNGTNITDGTITESKLAAADFHLSGSLMATGLAGFYGGTFTTLLQVGTNANFEISQDGTLSGTNIVSSGVFTGNGSGLTNVPGSCQVQLLDCSTGLVTVVLSQGTPYVLIKSNATYNAEIVANTTTNTVTGSLVWVDVQPINSTNWVLRW